MGQEREIVEIAPQDARLGEVVAVLLELRDHLDAGSLRSLYADAYPLGYRVAGLWDGGACRAAAGYRFGVNFANGPYLYVEDLVTSGTRRSRGYGKELIDHLFERARAEGCDCVTLDSGVQRFGAHRFYLREGFVISSHHFYRAVRDGAEPGSTKGVR